MKKPENPPAAPGPRDAARRDFARRVNHALRSDINTVRLALDAARRQIQSAVAAPSSSRDPLARLESAIAHMERRAMDIGLLTRAETGSLDLKRQPQRLRWVAQAALREYREMAASHHVRLVADVADCGTERASLDRTLMLKALGAVLSNAIRFSPEDGVVTVRAEARDGVARITVRDQGAGFSPGDARRVFKPFAVGGGTVSASGGGLGLGLAVARAIVTAHGGRIWVVRDRKPGGAVAIELPLA